VKFEELLKNKEAGGKEKHVPVIEIDKGTRKGVDIVRVIVGKEIPHARAQNCKTLVSATCGGFPC